MAKEFKDITFSPVEFKKELEKFEALLKLKPILEENEIQDFFDNARNLTAYVGIGAGLGMSIAKQVESQLVLMGDFIVDIAFGTREKAFCLVELEDGDPKSVLTKVGPREKPKATKEWGRRFEHGFSQLVDWFCLLDGQKGTPDFQKYFGYGHIDFVGLLLVGRNEGLSQDDVRRLRWRKHHVLVDSHPVFCMTYDELYEGLKETFELHAAAFTVESNPPAQAGQGAVPNPPAPPGTMPP
jgi:hypothetical protein